MNLPSHLLATLAAASAAIALSWLPVHDHTATARRPAHASGYLKAYEAAAQARHRQQAQAAIRAWQGNPMGGVVLEPVSGERP